jgi:hypothetical protein
MMHPDKMEKMKALDMMIVVGKPGEGKSEYKKEDKGMEGGSADEVLAMHPLDKMSNDELKKLYLAVDAEMESREEDGMEYDEDNE